jgi:hypothetical protein
MLFYKRVIDTIYAMLNYGPAPYNTIEVYNTTNGGALLPFTTYNTATSLVSTVIAVGRR